MGTVAPLDPPDLDARYGSAFLAAERRRRCPVTGTLADAETFAAAVLDAAAIMRDCPTTDSVAAEGIPDCPEVFLDFFDDVRLFRWWGEGAAELDRLTGLFNERELQ